MNKELFSNYSVWGLRNGSWVQLSAEVNYNEAKRFVEYWTHKYQIRKHSYTEATTGLQVKYFDTKDSEWKEATAEMKVTIFEKFGET